MTLPALARRKENPGRVYVHPLTDEEVPSVTNITGRKDKSGPLVGWAVKHSGIRHEAILAEWVEQFQEDPEFAAKMFVREFKTKKARSDSARAVKGARFDDRATKTFGASAAGTLVHDAIEHKVKHGTFGFSYGSQQEIRKAGLTDAEAIAEIQGWLDQYLAFAARFNPTWLELESTVWNRTLGYAGTQDGLMRLPNGRTYRVDFKTGNGVYPEYAMQLEALDRCEFVLDTQGKETPMEPADALAILHLRPEFYELHEVRRHDFVWDAFKGLLDVKKFDDLQHLVLGTRVRGEANKEEAQAA